SSDQARRDDLHERAPASRLVERRGIESDGTAPLRMREDRRQPRASKTVGDEDRDLRRGAGLELDDDEASDRSLAELLERDRQSELRRDLGRECDAQRDAELRET